MSKLIKIIVIIVIIVGGFFLFSGGDDEAPAETGGTTPPVTTTDTSGIDNAPDSEFPALDTSDQVFDELNLALDSLE